MKQRYLFIFILFFAFSSCEKDEDIEYPQWVADWITEIDTEEGCYQCEIFRYEYNGDFYYELYSPIMSCLVCAVFDSSGESIDWTVVDQADYMAKRKHRVSIYKKQSA